QYRATSIERIDFTTPTPVVTRFLQLVDQCMDDVVFDGHVVGRDVALGLAIEVDLADIEGIKAKAAGDIVNDVFNGQNALGPTKPAKCRIGLRVGFHA